MDLTSDNSTKKRKRKAIDDDEAEETPTQHDEPVKSHAARRKERKVQRQDPSGVTEEPKPKPAEVETSEAQPPSRARQNSIWIGNLAFKTTVESLKTFFDGVGEITRVHLPTKPVGGSGRGLRGDNMGLVYLLLVILTSYM
jgi:RNA recognition motif-containing protein